MFTAQKPPRWAPRKFLALLFLTCLTLFATSAIAAAHPFKSPTASVASAASRALTSAAAATTQADRMLVARATALRACQVRHREHCKASQTAVQRAGRKLAGSESRLAKLARRRNHRSQGSSGARQAPQLTISGQTLSWTRPGGVDQFVFVRKVPDQPDQYSVINGTSTTPPPVPGYSVRYSVRTNVSGSAWAPEQSIAYPAPAPPAVGPPSESLETTSTKPTTPPSKPTTPPSSTTPTQTTPPPTTPAPPTPPPSTPPPVNLQTAPIITVSGQTLTWVQIGNVNTYVFVTKVPGAPDQYSEISGTSVTPPAVPGVTVRYSVRTAVQGSAWAPEVSVTYPAAAPEPPKTEPPPSEPPVVEPPVEPELPGSSSGFQPGLNSGTDLTYDVPGAALLGAKVVRIEFSIGTAPAAMQNTIAGYAAKGIRVAPLAGFAGTMPTTSEAQNLANWAKVYGPGGSFWANRTDGNLAIQTIEFGNETSYGYQYGDSSSSASYATRARTYALRFKAAAEAISSAGVKVGLLAQDDNWTGDWMNGMYAAVPNFSSYVAGWVIHPYGAGWQSRVQDLINQAAAHGAPATIPIDITEWGIASDNGHCLSDNYGLNKCMSYSEAASTMSTIVGEIRHTLGSRLGLFMLYQIRDQAKPGASSDREAYFGALQHELQPKGAYTEQVKALLASS